MPTPPEGVSFHRFGITSSGGATAQLHSLPGVVAELNHTGRVVDIMKIDVEGAEFAVFSDAATREVLRRQVRQVLLEVHYRTEEGTVALARSLTDDGFYVFSKEPNIQYSGGECTEFSLLNVHLV